MAFDHSEERSQGSVHMDTVRGLAAITVMLGHSRGLFFSSLNGRPETSGASTGVAGKAHEQKGQITIGEEAVMIFFVLSGYLVGGSVLRAFQRSRWSWMDYISKRLARLWVVLIPALVLSVALDLTGMHLFKEPTSIYQGPSGQSEVSANLAGRLTPGVIAGNAVFVQTILVPTPGTNIPLWSLTNEFWYYLMFPLLMVVVWPRRSIAVRLVSLLVLAGLLYFTGPSIAMLFPTWLLGAGIALMPLRLSERVSGLLAVVLGLFLPAYMVVIRRLPIDEVTAQISIAVYFGVLLYVLLNRTRLARPGVYPRMATLLSNLSYPLYLIHLPVLVLLCAVVNRPWHAWTKTPAHFGAMLALNSVPLLVAYLLHVGFQRHTDAIRLYVVGSMRKRLHT